MNEDPRTPEPGEIQIVALLGVDKFIGWAPADTADALMDSFERRAHLTEEARTDQVVQAQVRMRIAQDLRDPNSGTLFRDVLAAGCLWLALRHWSNAALVRKGIDEQLATGRGVVVTASIADPAPNGAMKDTAWAFMVGDRIHDGRGQLANRVPNEVVLTDNTGNGHGG